MSISGVQNLFARKVLSTEVTIYLTIFSALLQTVLTTIEPLRNNRESSFDAYEYTVHSHTYQSDEIPEAKFTYDMSPIQIVVTEKPKYLYHFITTTCAIIGGVFTVAGIIDGLLHTSLKIAKKVELGKQG